MVPKLGIAFAFKDVMLGLTAPETSRNIPLRAPKAAAIGESIEEVLLRWAEEQSLAGGSIEGDASTEEG